MIFVTGDVHDPAMGGADQAWLARHGLPDEVACAEKFARIAERHGVPVTLFLTGRCAPAAPDALRRLAANPLVELGGHTWNGLQPAWRHMLRERRDGSFYGSAPAQRADVTRTLGALGAAAGRPITLWRTHAFRGDRVTLEVIEDQGVRVVSDRVDPEGRIEHVGRRLVSVPVNTPVDHDHMLHGAFTRSWVERDAEIRADPRAALRRPWQGRNLARGAKELVKRGLGLPAPRPSADRRDPAAWWRWTREALDQRLAARGFATLLLHPACMEIVDGMALLDTIFRELARLPCRRRADAAPTEAGHG